MLDVVFDFDFESGFKFLCFKLFLSFFCDIGWVLVFVFWEYWFINVDEFDDYILVMVCYI